MEGGSMEKRKSLFDRIALPTRIIVNRRELSAADFGEIVQRGALGPAGEDTCELEAGGQILARGKIVKRRGRYFFKVLETAEEEKK
jgi:hypothetical protein